MNRPVNVIVPIFRGVALTKRCLESLSSSQLPRQCRVTLIDDASPETRMTEMLATFIEAASSAHHASNANGERQEWELLRNATNCGFVASVNRGMAHHPDHDVVLLNSDTEVPPGWLQRLSAAVYSRSDIGTATPFSNCGSLASYPVPNTENTLPPEISIERLDQFFKVANAGTTINIPIGVGFCLFIRRDCLDDIGSFDEATFGKGYGEENDFCLRASLRGWTHVLAADCFVYHKGRGSFGEEKDQRVRQAYALLAARYPHYPALIQRHFADDPARPYRFRADLLRLADNTTGVHLVVTSGRSTSVGLVFSAAAPPVLQLSPFRAGHFVLRWLNDGEAFSLWFRLPEELNTLRELIFTLPVIDHQGDGPSWLMDALSAPTDVSGPERAPAQLFGLIAQHGKPRFSGWQALQQTLADHGLNLSGLRLIRPLAALLPEAVRSRIRRWIRTNRP